MSRYTIREGSRRALDFWLQTDTNGDGHPDTAIVLTGLQSLELRVRDKAGVVRGFLSTAPSPQLTVVVGDGTATAPNGQPASHVQFVPAAADFLSANGPYDLYFILVPASGIPETIPEHEHDTLFVTEAF